MLHIPRTRKIVKPSHSDIQRFGISGRLRAALIDVYTGRIQRYLNRNIFTQAGLAAIPLSLFQAREFYVTQLGVGTGTTTPADTDTGLTTSVLVKAITEAIDESNLTGSTPYAIATVQFNTGEANGNLTEAGLFDSDDVMQNHALFGTGSITGATAADPVVITDVAHGLSSGDRVLITGVLGMTQLNGNLYYASVLSSSTFSLYNDASLSDTVDGSGFSAYSSAGTWFISIPKTSSNILQVSFEIQAQNA